MEAQKGGGGRQDEERRVDLCCLRLLKNKACRCALCACSGLAEAEMAGRKGAAVAECAH